MAAELDLDLDLELEARCAPAAHDTLHSFEIEGRLRDRTVCTLSALRFSMLDFHFSEAGLHELVWAFDHQSQESYDLAEEVRSCGPALRGRFEDTSACGVVAILQVRTVPSMTGRRISVELLRHLRELHLGLPWFACLYAAPMDLDEGTGLHREMQERLINYYGSEPELDFARARIGTPLMVARWSEEES